jgi:hypothetical protein
VRATTYPGVEAVTAFMDAVAREHFGGRMVRCGGVDIDDKPPSMPGSAPTTRPPLIPPLGAARPPSTDVAPHHQAPQRHRRPGFRS